MTADDDKSQPADDRVPTMAPGQWMGIIRRAVIDLERKGALLILGSYATFKDDPETGKIAGEDVHPGTDRYAQDLGLSVATGRRYLKWARELGVIELTRRANRRKKLCDEYRLTMSIDAQERLGVPDPTAYKELIGEGARARRASAKAARMRRAAPTGGDGPDDEGPEPGRGDDDYRSSRVSANPAVDDSDYRSSRVSANAGPSDDHPDTDQRSSRVSADTSISAQTGPGLALTLDERTPKHVLTVHKPLTEHEIVDLRTDLTVPRAREPVEDPIFGGVDTTPEGSPPGGDPLPGSGKCPHGMPATVHDGGIPTCPLCRLEKPGLFAVSHAPAPALLSAEMNDQVDAVVNAYVDAYEAAGGRCPIAWRTRIGRQARPALVGGTPFDAVLTAARTIGERGMDNLGGQLAEDASATGERASS